MKFDKLETEKLVGKKIFVQSYTFDEKTLSFNYTVVERTVLKSVGHRHGGRNSQYYLVLNEPVNVEGNLISEFKISDVMTENNSENRTYKFYEYVFSGVFLNTKNIPALPHGAILCE